MNSPIVYTFDQIKPSLDQSDCYVKYEDMLLFLDSIRDGIERKLSELNPKDSHPPAYGFISSLSVLDEHIEDSKIVARWY